ncbi:MAG: GNAT family N-acetyltransferase [Actinomycetota bacterium]
MIDFARASDRATPGFERTTVGEWIVRNGEGETGRANSVTPLGDPGRSVVDAIDQVESWYRARSRPPQFQIFDETAPDVVDQLDRRGYEIGATTDVLAAPVDEVVARIATPPFTTEVVTQMPTFLRSQLADARAAEMLSAELARWFVIAAAGGPVIGSGMALADDALVGIFAMRTDPEQQGRGAGSGVMRALLEEGRRRGATTAWLQVESANRRAADWYARLGFERQTGYRYRLLRDTFRSPDAD